MKYKLDQVSVRLVKEPPLLSDEPITDPGSAVSLLVNTLCDLDREMMVIVNLRNDGRPINMNIMSIGTINCTIVVPREALKASVLSNASNVLLAHNHPSGTLTPSKEDVQVTDQMIKAYELLGIGVLDHVIIAPDQSFYSMREREVFQSHTTEYKDRLDSLQFSFQPKQKNSEER